MKPQINAIYLSVKNMSRGVKFYEDLLKIKVTSQDNEFATFKFNGITLLLFNPKIKKEKITYGNNAVLNIQVDNIKKIFNSLKNKNCKIVLPLQRADKYIIFQILDTEGNTIELYQEV